MATSHEFNSMSNLEKLCRATLVAGNNLDLFALQKVADTLNKLQDIEPDLGTIRLVQLLSKEDRLGGCEWCGG